MGGANSRKRRGENRSREGFEFQQHSEYAGSAQPRTTGSWRQLAVREALGMGVQALYNAATCPRTSQAEQAAGADLPGLDCRNTLDWHSGDWMERGEALRRSAAARSSPLRRMRRLSRS